MGIQFRSLYMHTFNLQSKEREIANKLECHFNRSKENKRRHPAINAIT